MACVRLLAIRIVRIARNAIHIFKNVAGLAIQCRTDGGEGGKADGGNAIVFDFGKVHVGDAHLIGQPVELAASLDHDAVEAQDDMAYAGRTGGV